MHLWLYKGQALPENIHLYLQVWSPSCHDLQDQSYLCKTNNPSEKCDSLSLYLCLCMHCLCPLPAQILYIPKIQLQLSLPTKRLIVRLLGDVPLSRHYVLDVTNMFHFTSTSSGRDQFNLIAFKRDNSEVSDILGIKSTSGMVFNQYCITFSKVMGKLFRESM